MMTLLMRREQKRHQDKAGLLQRMGKDLPHKLHRELWRLSKNCPGTLCLMPHWCCCCCWWWQCRHGGVQKWLVRMWKSCIWSLSIYETLATVLRSQKGQWDFGPQTSRTGASCSPFIEEAVRLMSYCWWGGVTSVCVQQVTLSTWSGERIWRKNRSPWEWSKEENRLQPHRWLNI